ncbi:16216_t:CDS:2 [Acaulospora colombiana]|uniref:16216_t:CDS:1 n=1 Tax=Acaulospora colombiana TaxID=27376 RepID=A0ACA9KZR9_9GLOM|nr:16216_t:CDS:2 [Acaulospora colombiana]
MGGGNDSPQGNQTAETLSASQTASSPSTDEAHDKTLVSEAGQDIQSGGESAGSVDSQKTLEGTETQLPEASGSIGPQALPKEYEVTFEKNAEFMENIRNETAKKSPLVCCSESIDRLYEEYQNGSEVYQQKIMDRTLGQEALTVLASTKPLLESTGYQSLVYEDFYDVFEEQLKAIVEGGRDEDTLLSVFQTDEISNQLVLYLRFVTAGYLKKHREDYEPFLEFDYGMTQFCNKYVEAMDQEADHVHVIALTKALKVPVEIAYMSGSSAMEQVNFHEFYPEEESTKEHPLLEPLVLLYRPGHYDILYRDE